MGIMSGADRERVRRHLAGLTAPVTLVHFTQDYDFVYTRRAREFLEELTGLSGRIQLRIVDFVHERETAMRFGVDHVPATVISGECGLGLRFDGLPDGAELGTFLDGIVMMSRGGPAPGPRLAVLASPPTRDVVAPPG